MIGNLWKGHAVPVGWKPNPKHPSGAASFPNAITRLLCKIWQDWALGTFVFDPKEQGNWAFQFNSTYDKDIYNTEDEHEYRGTRTHHCQLMLC